MNKIDFYYGVSWIFHDFGDGFVFVLGFTDFFFFLLWFMMPSLIHIRIVSLITHNECLLSDHSALAFYVTVLAFFLPKKREFRLLNKIDFY